MAHDYPSARNLRLLAYSARVSALEVQVTELRTLFSTLDAYGNIISEQAKELSIAKQKINKLEQKLKKKGD